MKGTEVHQVLKQIRATHLHHANSVATSCTFLEQRGLASRGFVEDHGLAQTPQNSDAIDRKFGIWHDVFVDHVDIHDRAGRRKGPNQYGPVLFVLDLDILLALPKDSEVLVTKKNPVHWIRNEPDDARWFQSAAELGNNICFGDFDKMLVIRTPRGKLDFPDRRASVVLDDPGQCVSSGEDAYAHAEKSLREAAATSGMRLSLARRQCRYGCVCSEKYAAFGKKKIDFYFT